MGSPSMAAVSFSLPFADPAAALVEVEALVRTLATLRRVMCW